jgi:Cell wall-active antibiotics response 4TMS YvqF
MPVRSSWSSLFGTIILDLREARLAGPEVELDIYNLFGTVTVLVPPGVQLDVEGSALFASQVIEPPSMPPPPGAPRLRIRTSGPGGTLYVRAPGRD